MKKNLVITTILALSVFAFSAWRINKANENIGQLEIQAKSLTYKQEAQYSAGNITVLTLKSFWDGLTFGQFAEDGILTEYHKANKFDLSVKREADEINSAYNSNRSSIFTWVKVRSTSLYVAIFCVVILVLIIRKSNKQNA